MIKKAGDCWRAWNRRQVSKKRGSEDGRISNGNVAFERRQSRMRSRRRRYPRWNIRRQQYGEENFVYLLSYVPAPRSSDVSGQFRRLQSDRRVGETETGPERGGTWKSRFLRQYLRNITLRRRSIYSPTDTRTNLDVPVHPRASPAFRNNFLSSRCNNESRIPHYRIMSCG